MIKKFGFAFVQLIETKKMEKIYLKSYFFKKQEWLYYYQIK